MKEEESYLISPNELLEQWEAEIAGLRRKKELAMQKYKNWSGYSYEAKKSIMGEAYEDDFAEAMGKIKEIGEQYEVDFTIIDDSNVQDIPTDLFFDEEKGFYYSPSEDKYYTKKSIEDNL